MKFKYDVSIIIPVYNVEDYVEECIKSILNQNYDINKIQIILIDDGSIDNSYKICENYSKKYDNILLLKQKNSGVSEARNNGIKNSLGKYIMLLDSDDYLSKNAIKNLFEFFENHYDELDIVTYPIKFDRRGKISNNIRYNQYDKGTNIYDINEYIYLNQSTVNIMIKNEGKKTNLYNTSMKLSEDQNFDTELIMKKEKIGYVEDAIYYYRRYDSSVSSSRNNPYYCFDDIMSYNESLIKKYKKNNKIPKYIQSLVINTIKWRLRTDELFPYGLDEKEFKKALKRIKKLVSYIDTDVIMNVPDMNFYHKVFLLDISDRNLEINFKGNMINLYSNNEFVKEFEYIDGLITRIRLKNNNLYLMGSLFNPIFTSVKPKLYIEKVYRDDIVKTDEIDTFISNDSYHLTNFKTTVSYAFDFSFNIDNIKSFKIYLKLNNKKINLSFTFRRFASNNFITNNKNILYSKKDLCFKIRRKNVITLLKSRIRNFITALKSNRRACIYRILYYFSFRKNVWIYTDRGDALDNAYTQFIHDFNKNDNIKRYYISRFKENEVDKYFTKEQKKYIVKQNSLKHKMLFLHSKKIISSFTDLQVYCPFNTSVNLYNDLTCYDLIYLQHGILHANLLKMYAKEFTEIDKFVISTTFEKDNLINKYHYKEEDLLLTGMPRIKNNLNTNHTKNIILFAPSWRKYLIGNLIKNQRKLKTNDFINSKFYKEIYGFLLSKELEELLKKNKFTLEFKLHPIFKGYANLFKLDSKYINMNFDKTDVTDFKIFITDFSSFQFDFVKLKRPIVYFMPDMVEFKSGLHTYRELDLKYEDAFGKLCLTKEELLKELKKIIKNDSKVDKQYLKRMDNFFLDINNPTDEIYSKLIKESK